MSILFSYCSHDHRGELYRVNWSHFGRDSHLDCDIDKIDELYKAMRTFDDIMNDPKNHIRLKMQPGKAWEAWEAGGGWV